MHQLAVTPYEVGTLLAKGPAGETPWERALWVWCCVGSARGVSLRSVGSC